MVTREDILTKASTFDIFEYFLREYYDKEGVSVRPGVHVYVPEISGEQKTPSFNIYYSRKSNEYRYKDFTGNDGSVFDMIMNLYNVSFPESLKIIDKEMNLGLYDSVTCLVSKVQPKPKQERLIPIRNFSYELIEAKWTKRHLKFWARYGTGLETLIKYNYKPLRRLSAFDKDNIPYTVESAPNGLIFAFERGSWGKWYSPEIKGVQAKRFGYFGNKPNDYVFGLEQLPDTGDDCYLIAGEKDCINMHSHDKWAVCLTSEESSPRNYPKLLELINSDRFKRYFILYDNDSTGQKQMKKINAEFPQLIIKQLDIPEGWDLSDFLASKYSKLMF